MKKFIKWYYSTWIKPENEWDGMDAINMCWTSVFIVLVIGGFVILTALAYNYFTG